VLLLDSDVVLAKPVDDLLDAIGIIGAGCVILPGVTIGRGGAVGALTVVREDVPEFAIAAGPRGELIGERDRRSLTLERELREEEDASRP
jgi:dTDP-4-amino-4,6-dideoxy-D-glucose acyltransferase